MTTFFYIHDEEVKKSASIVRDVNIIPLTILHDASVRIKL